MSSSPVFIWAFVILAAMLLRPVSSTAESVPEGWYIAGSRPTDYTAGTISDAGRHGTASAYLASREEVVEGFGTLMQEFSAERFLGKRVRMTGFVRAESVEGRAGLWMRVDDTDRASLSFDNMQDRPIRGTLPWQRYEIVLDVPYESASIAFGILLRGKGKVYVDDFAFEEVAPTVEATGIATALSATPVNLAFEQ